jgi:hypothetical protein
LAVTTLDSYIEGKICEECGKIFEPYNTTIKTQRFCSRHCYTLKYNREYFRLPGKREYQKLPEYKERGRQRRIKSRLCLINHLGGAKCLHCGCEEYNILQIDHINPKHAIEDRARFNNNIVRDTYYNKNVKEAKSKLRVLCRSCNLGRNKKD